MERLGNYIVEYSVRNKSNEEIPVFSVTNEKGFCTGYFDKEVASKERKSYKIVPKGYFAYNPSRINVGSVDWQRVEDRVIVSPLYVVFGVSSKIMPQYLYYFLKSGVAKNYIQQKSQGSVRNNFKFSMLADMELPIPSIDKQNDIVKMLNKIQKITTLKTKELSLINTAERARFVEMFGDPVINPNHYQVHQLKDFIENLTSGSRGWAKYCIDGGNEWFITIKNVKDSHILTDNMQPVNAPNNVEAKRTRVQEGDLLISITADLGRTGVVTKEIADHGAYINQHLTCIRLNREYVDPLFVSFFMESAAGKRQFAAKNQNAVKAGLNFTAIESLKLFVPPFSEQRKFVLFAEQVDKSKTNFNPFNFIAIIFLQ